ncbi:hypothetical protein CDAR_507741 [Caerostris darwini]|uniref:Uncharacterized protein n=1 Tax=Caerostris darwini TaxID=1538125 RepID=A0AAV4QX92_9ARAC|nr:hypothetical protein CDAR_507741 [Caerostris darwini]
MAGRQAFHSSIEVKWGAGGYFGCWQKECYMDDVKVKMISSMQHWNRAKRRLRLSYECGFRICKFPNLFLSLSAGFWCKYLPVTKFGI